MDPPSSSCCCPPSSGDRAVHTALFQSSFTGLGIACFAFHTAGLNSLVGKLFCGCIRITWSNSHIHTTSLGQFQPLFQGSFILGAVSCILALFNAIWHGKTTQTGCHQPIHCMPGFGNLGYVASFVSHTHLPAWVSSA